MSIQNLSQPPILLSILESNLSPVLLLVVWSIICLYFYIYGEATLTLFTYYSCIHCTLIEWDGGDREEISLCSPFIMQIEHIS